MYNNFTYSINNLFKSNHPIKKLRRLKILNQSSGGLRHSTKRTLKIEEDTFPMAFHEGAQRGYKTWLMDGRFANACFPQEKPFSRHYQGEDFPVGSRAPENSGGEKLAHDHSHHLCANLGNLVIVFRVHYCATFLFSYQMISCGVSENVSAIKIKYDRELLPFLV